VSAEIDRVTNDDIVRIAQKLFRPGEMALTVLGDMKGTKIDAEVLAG
jgi:hypothetical protein